MPQLSTVLLGNLLQFCAKLFATFIFFIMIWDIFFCLFEAKIYKTLWASIELVFACLPFKFWRNDWFFLNNIFFLAEHCLKLPDLLERFTVLNNCPCPTRVLVQVIRIQISNHIPLNQYFTFSLVSQNKSKSNGFCSNKIPTNSFGMVMTLVKVYYTLYVAYKTFITV